MSEKKILIFNEGSYICTFTETGIADVSKQHELQITGVQNEVCINILNERKTHRGHSSKEYDTGSLINIRV